MGNPPTPTGPQAYFKTEILNMERVFSATKSWKGPQRRTSEKTTSSPTKKASWHILYLLFGHQDGAGIQNYILIWSSLPPPHHLLPLKLICWALKLQRTENFRPDHLRPKMVSYADGRTLSSSWIQSFTMFVLDIMKGK